VPHTPQTAVTRLLQSVTDSRNIVAGDWVEIRPQLIVLGSRDGLAVLKAYLLAGGEKIANPDRVLLFVDDHLPAPDLAVANRRKQLHEAATQAGIKRVLPFAGCELAHVMQENLVVPGEVAVSNLPEIHRLGGIGALGLRVTVRDIAGFLAGKPLGLTVPQTTRVDLTGERQPPASGRDAFFAIRRETSRDRLVGRALEVAGCETLSLHDRADLCEQAAHAGLAAVVCLPDQASVAELNKRCARPYTTHQPEKDAAYAHRAQLDLANAQLSVVPPDGPDSWRTAGEFSGQPVSAVVISGGFEDLETAGDIIKLRHRNPQVRCCAVPDSRETYRKALESDLIAALIEAGVEVHPPGTSADAILRGEPGLVTGLVAPPGCWRAGVVTAATAACAGAIVHPDRLDNQPQRDSKLSGRKPRL
jgi:3-isopropylmalate/(R)-2-methylmalate dehydratase large subunit